MYRELVEHILLPIVNRKFREYYQELRKTCQLSAEEINKIQSDRLRKLVKHAYENVPYYQKIFKGKGLSPEDIKGTGDLIKLPVLTKGDIRTNFNNLIARNFPKKEMLPYSTGGSTGEPLQFYITNESKAWGSAAGYRAYGWYGYRLGDKVAYLWGSPVDLSRQQEVRGKLQNCVLRTIYLNTSDMSEEKVKEFASQLIRFKPKTIIAYASAAYLFARYVQSGGIKGIKPEVIITQAEQLFDYQRETIKEAFDCEVFDFYGSREVSSMAAECPQHKGYHISGENIVLEFVKDSGAPVLPGELGEILVTDLHNYAMPLIRYEIGDLGVPTDKNCSCGINLPLMKSVQGRITDVLVIGDKLISSPVLTLVFKDLPIKQYQVIQESEDRILVKIVKESNYSEGHTEEIHRLLRKIVGSSVSIDIIFADSIPLTAYGKHRFVISSVSPGL